MENTPALTLKPKIADKRSLYHKFLMVLSSIMKNEPIYFITPHEVYLLTELLLLPEKYKYARFSSPAKKYLMRMLKEQYDLSVSPQNLNTKIYALIDKGFIWRDEDNVLYLSDTLTKFATKVERMDLDKVKINIDFVKVTA